MANNSPVERCFDIVELLSREGQGLPLSTIGQQLDLPKSVVHRFLAILNDRGYVEKDDISGRYHLTLTLPAIGFRYLGSTGITDVCQPVLNRIGEKTGDLVRMAVVDGDRLIWVSRAQGANSALRYDPRIGKDVIPFSTAAGTAWLSSLPEAEAVRIVLNLGFDLPPDYGHKAVRTVPNLLKKLNETRARGYGLAIEEGEPGTHAVAVAFRSEDSPESPVVGTVSVAGPSMRLPVKRLTEIAELLKDEARELTMRWPMRRHMHENEATVYAEHQTRGQRNQVQ